MHTGRVRDAPAVGHIEFLNPAQVHKGSVRDLSAVANVSVWIPRRCTKAASVNLEHYYIFTV